jgi:hypothetical protein
MIEFIIPHSLLYGKTGVGRTPRNFLANLVRLSELVLKEDGFVSGIILVSYENTQFIGYQHL